MEPSITKEIHVVKIVIGAKLCYNLLMKDSEHQHIPEQETEACTNHAPMQRAMNLLGDSWTLMIIYNLLNGPRRFGELRDAMGNVSPKTVSQRLKMLEEDTFVVRRAFAEIPPRVEYELTEKGLALAGVLEAIQQFSERYLSDNEETHATSSPASSHLCP